MLPAVRAVVDTEEGAESLFDFSGRTVWVDRDGVRAGSQLLLGLFEAEHASNVWLNNSVCIVEGVMNPQKMTAHFEIHECLSDLI